MASRYPRAEWNPLGPQSEPLMRAHDVVCVHTMVGYLWSTDSYFRTRNGRGYDGTESHYGIGGRWGSDADRGLDGVAWQWQDRARQADANGEGGARVISIETADNAPARARDIARWTPAQAARLVDLIAWECSPAAHAACPSGWACRRGGTWSGARVAIPPTLVPDSRPGRRGLAVHRQGIQHSLGVGRVPGWLVTGGEEWSSSVGKECPGDARVRQFVTEIIPAVQARIRATIPRPPAPAPPPVPAPLPEPTPAPPTTSLESQMVYRITLTDGPEQYIVGLNTPGEVQHIRNTGEATALAKVFPTLVLTREALLHYFYVPSVETPPGAAPEPAPPAAP